MTALEQLAPTPRLVERTFADVDASPAAAWGAIRHLDLARSPIVRALFRTRTLPDRWRRRAAEPDVGARLDDLVSTRERPGFQILADDPPHEVAVGAIGKVWKLAIPFMHVDDAAAFAAFAEPGWIKVAWAVRVLPRGEHGARIAFELRVDATDDASWRNFRRYFRLIGPASRFIRRRVLRSFVRDLGAAGATDDMRLLPGDELLPDASGQITSGITIAAPPERIWPWLAQMGCQRAGWYSVDALDNGGRRSAREIHPELQAIAVGDAIPATPDGRRTFEVLRVDAPRTLVLGGLYDVGEDRQLPFAAARPSRFWQVTWAFVLEPLDDRTTRLHVRARAAFPPDGRRHALWIRPIHRFMEAAQLRHLAARAEGRLARDDVRDVVEGLAGAARMAATFLRPWQRELRSRWGLDEALAARTYPGDERVPSPRWGWTHAVTVDAPAEAVFPLVAQIGADRGGFYSYQWLENVAGCGVRNAETVHPELALREGDALVLHPAAPPLRVVEVSAGPGARYLVAFGAPDEESRAARRAWAAATWAFVVEPLGPSRCRVISRFRSVSSNDAASRIRNGPALVEPIGFVMDRRMLLGIKSRAEAAQAPRRDGSGERATAATHAE